MSIYEETVPLYRQALSNLIGFIDKAQQHPQSDALLEARLIDEMHPLATQIRFVGNLPAEAIERLTDRDFTSREEDDRTLGDAREALEKMIAFLDGVNADELIDGGKTMVVDLPNGMEFTLTANEYIRNHSLPNFYFHLSMAYGILRKEGVDVGKADYLAHMFRFITKMPGS